MLERVTYYVNGRSRRENNDEPQRVKLVFSERGGQSYAQMNAYYEWLKYKNTAGRQVLTLGEISYDVIHRELLEVFNHSQLPGLQLADIVASAFFKGADVYDTRAADPQFAELLRPIMAKQFGQVAGFGVKLMPGLRKADLLSEQEVLFRTYGYPR